MKLSEITENVLKAAFKVHTALGPGLLESVYEVCLAHEIGKMRLRVEAQKALPVTYDGVRLSTGLTLDLVVEGIVVVELKAVETILEVHKAQVLTYLKLSGLPVGLLPNFNVVHMRDGITRLVNPRSAKQEDLAVPPLTSVPSDTSL